MIWNYRVVRSDDQYAIHEVYYKDESMHVIAGFSSAPAYPRGETIEAFAEDLSRYLESARHPALIEDASGALKEEMNPTLHCDTAG